MKNYILLVSKHTNFIKRNTKLGTRNFNIQYRKFFLFYKINW